MAEGICSAEENCDSEAVLCEGSTADVSQTMESVGASEHRNLSLTVGPTKVRVQVIISTDCLELQAAL